MANWRRGFFRLWVLLTALWLVIIGAIVVPAYLNPVLPDRYFTINDDGTLETLEPFSERHITIYADTDKTLYQKVSFKDDAPEVTYFAPNKIDVFVRGRTYQALVTTANLEPAGRETLIDSLVSYILTQETEPQDLVILRPEVAAALPVALKPKWVTRETGERVKQYAAGLHRAAVDATHQAQITAALLYGILPPMVVLILGAAIGWALTGFRRERMPS